MKEVSSGLSTSSSSAVGIKAREVLSLCPDWSTRHTCFEIMSRSVEKPPRLWFYFCGFSFAIFAGLFVGFFGWLLGRWRGMLAAFLGIALYAVLAGASGGGCAGKARPTGVAGAGRPHATTHGSQRMDRAEHRWRADVGGGGTKVGPRPVRQYPPQMC
jgi:hypothetical protein